MVRLTLIHRDAGEDEVALVAVFDGAGIVQVQNEHVKTQPGGGTWPPTDRVTTALPTAKTSYLFGRNMSTPRLSLLQGRHLRKWGDNEVLPAKAPTPLRRAFATTAGGGQAAGAYTAVSACRSKAPVGRRTLDGAAAPAAAPPAARRRLGDHRRAPAPGSSGR